jgi:hypothetical protein
MNTGAFGQLGGLFKFCCENIKNSSLSTVITYIFYPFKHILAFFGHVL